MILQYLSIEQTLTYLERETGYQYTFNDLKELSYLKEIDVFFYKVGAIYHHERKVEPAPFVKHDHPPTAIKSWDYATYIERVRGIFYVEDLIMYEPTDAEKTYYFNYKFVTVEKVIEHLCFLSNEKRSHKKGDQGELADIGLLDLEFYDNNKVKLSSVRMKKITTVKRNELRFKKAQLDKLIKQSASSISTLEKIDSLQTENEQLKQCIFELESQLEQVKNGQPTAFKEQKQKTQKNRDDEIVVYLSFLLAQKSNTFGKSDGSINASQVGQAINGIAQQLGLDKDDMHGFKRPDARIRDLIKEHGNLLVKFKELVKK